MSLTLKQIGKKIKAKGLGQLKFYCQMCQKQCRDQNGFKCHLTSESHLRQMELFAQNPEHYLEALSQEFEESFLTLLSRRFNTKRVEANRVYNEFVQDKDHTHMNSTKWESLSGFVQYLSTSGKVLVDESDKGLYITWIDRDPEVLARQERLAKKEKAAQDDTALMEKLMRKRAALARSEAASIGVAIEQAAATGIRKGAADVAFRVSSISGGATNSVRGGGGGGEKIGNGSLKPTRRQALNFNDRTAAVISGVTAQNAGEDAGVPPPSKRARITFTEGTDASASLASASSSEVVSAGATGGRPLCWLCESLVVKCKNRVVGDGRYYKKKARVLHVNDGSGAGQTAVTADVRMMDTGHKLRIDQSDLETVIPKPRMPDGRSRVMLLSGAQRGMTGTLVALHLDRFCADVELDDGTGRVATGVEYEDLCKMAVLSPEEEKKAMKEKRRKEKREKKKEKKDKKKKKKKKKER